MISNENANIRQTLPSLGKGRSCVIIGSGLGGLSCGLILAKNGYDVTILEQDAQIGGCLQCFRRKGVKYETGMHFIGSAAEGQTLNRLLRYLGVLDDVTLSPLDTEGYDVVSLGDERYPFANGRERFISRMSRFFPDEHDNLEKYFDIVEMVANASSLHSLKHTEDDGAVSMEYQLRSINDVIGSVIDNPLLCNVLAGNLPLYAAEKGKTPFSTHAFVMDFYNQSAYRVVGGSDGIASSLANTIRKMGGRILTSCKVAEIVCDDSHATGVKTTDGEFFPADIVISDAHPVRTIEMVGSPLLRPAYRHRIESLRNTVGGFSVYLHFKKDAVPYMNYNFYGYRQSSPWDCEQYDESSWPKGYLYMHFCQHRLQRFATSGVILSYMNYDDVARWANTSVGHRGEDYEKFKSRKAEQLIQQVEKDFPELRGNIADYYTSTPLTYLDYTGTVAGSMYGISKDINLGPACRVHHRTKIPNLLLTGQNINSHGILGVLVGTIVTCSELLTSEHIFNQIMEANR